MEAVKSSQEKSGSNIAWFKLSQLVSRGEKEKALGLYKLLSYSLDDKAYALQVEGDLLWAFGDDKDAVERYMQAAYLYKKDQKIVSSAGVYEHIFLLEPENYEILETLVECYARLDWYERMQDRCEKLISLAEEKKLSKDRLLKIFKIAGETYKFDNKKRSLKRFTNYLKTKGEDIASIAKLL
ncbi:hypothetical protein KAW80_00845 [Candidatus Babeliales bacterium]|nr:hypothetical protein [Candidatus Babeliales bacterium]